jgi:hypothetical protein
MNATYPQPIPDRKPAPPPPKPPSPPGTAGKLREEKTDLQRAIEALENAGFHVSRAYEENNRDAGNSDRKYSHLQDTTGAICLRIIPNRIIGHGKHP